MALSKCPHCKGGFFEVVTKEPRGARFKTIFVQCSSCGAPFGVQEFYNLSAELDDVKKALKKLGQQIDALTYSVAQIERRLKR